jgi:hypothetical protein
MGKKTQRMAMPVLIGGSLATVIHILFHTKTGQKLASKLKLPFALVQGTDAQAEQAQEDAPAAAAAPEATAGLAGYMTVSQYMGSMDISPMGPSWYGRGDMGDYVDSAPQNEFGEYTASDFPVHSPGPGDNINVMATLGSYGAAYPPGGYDGYGEMQLEETPGGTMILAGGIFDGKSCI